MTITQPENWQPQGIDVLESRAWDALRQVHKSVLVTAGAGAGKTEFLAQKATYLLQTGLCPSPKRILAISFKRDAAHNLRARVEKRCPSEQARRFNSFTFDAFSKNLLDRFRAAIPAPFSPPNNYRIVMPRRQDYQDFLAEHGHYTVDTRVLERSIATTRLPINDNEGITGIVAEYWQKQYSNYDDVPLSFSMINRLVEWLLRENPSIHTALQLTYPVVFLDEFQDTTSAQFELIRTAFDNSDTVFTAVGDDKQRIMGWAGAMPDAFDRFQKVFAAEHIPLLFNWRSHDELVRFQHLIASRIDPEVEIPEARADRSVDGDIAAIWDFNSNKDEAKGLVAWIYKEVRSGNIEPHDIAILVRMHAKNVEEELAPEFSHFGLRLRNEARNVGEIAIQDLLSQELTEIFMPLLRLGAETRSPKNWNAAIQYMQLLESVDPEDNLAQQELQNKLQKFVRELRDFMRRHNPEPKTARQIAQITMDFITEHCLRRAIPVYQRKLDFDRVWNGFTTLLAECADHADTWSNAFDEFMGLGQVPLMTIHKSKGLEFHTIVFYGLDNQTWWSLKPDRPEELNTLFVAFTRAKQRAFFTLCRERGEPVTWIENLLKPSGVCHVDGTTLPAKLNHDKNPTK